MKPSFLNKCTFRLTCLIGSILLVLWMQCCGLFLGTARADEAALIEIESQIGFGASNVKQGRWTPVTMTLRNQGADLSGDLVIQVANPNRNKDFNYVQHVELPKGSTKVVTMLIPGNGYTKSNNTIAFYEKSQKNGKKITLAGNTYLEAFSLPKETLQVGVLARDVDTLNFLTLLNQSGNKVNVLHLKQEDIPKESLGLDSLDVLAINDFAADTLTSEQVQAIGLWTQRGGTLLLAGGAGYPKSAAPFAKASPVTYEGTTELNELPTVEKIGEKELVFPQPFTLSQAKLTGGAESILSEGTLPVIARSVYGSGFVTYAAYDLSLNPLASWNGNPRLWEQILSGPIEAAHAFNLNQMKFGNDPMWEMERALEFFPSLQPPKLPMLALVLLLYAILVGPLLYMVLRKLDRREWAWLVIPIAAILTSIGVFQFGATNRGSMMAQSLSTVSLNGTGSGIKQSALSVFLPKGGDLELKFTGKPVVSPLLLSDVYPGLQLHDQSELVVSKEPEATLVRLQGIPYSSISKLALGEEQLVSIGKIDYTISELSAKGAKGQVTNNTTKDLTDAAVVINQSYVKIGDIPAGASANFDTTGGIGMTNGFDVPQLAFPYPTNNSLDTNLHQRSLLSSYLNRKGNYSGGITPMVIGWMKDQSSITLTSGGSIPIEQLTLVSQDMKFNYVTPEGKIVIPSTALIPALIDNHLRMSSIQFQNGPFMQMGSGDVTLDYQLPNLAGASYQTMEMTADPNPDVTTELWNSETKAWEAITLQSFQSWEGEKLQPFLIEGKSIRMKVTTVQNNTMFRMPAVSLEGAVKR
ncbi:hypothetical protein [Paenibacillus aceris]|uniref:DUF4350 domain-containing protein n=1 Tax=Paenibacillus aceris TaxID=869555 RepID=A0ABS4HS36_9BACL|nr:hypothetical protein [Paenibacillus aceris]MBP1961432.1 hypothetical protein [Paenibacillus aceris]NHW37789.1 hypothetical protein [Paenibacillus aceris]